MPSAGRFGLAVARTDNAVAGSSFLGKSFAAPAGPIPLAQSAAIGENGGSPARAGVFTDVKLSRNQKPFDRHGRPLPASELPKQYDHAAAQERWYPVWKERGYFHSEPDPKRRPYTIVIPPPNVTGALHLGHALNATLQDTLIRWRRMQGYNVLWMPGTDHAGIATQAVVERRLLEEEKKTRHDLGRAALVERIWAWKQEYETRILGQLARMGASCDWARTRFTLDPICARPCGIRSFACSRIGSSIAASDW